MCHVKKYLPVIIQHFVPININNINLSRDRAIPIQGKGQTEIEWRIPDTK